MTQTRCEIDGCETAKIAARKKCWRHYRQELRGRLGKVAPRAPYGEGSEITLRITRSQLITLKTLAAQRETTVRAIIRQALDAHLAGVVGAQQHPNP